MSSLPPAASSCNQNSQVKISKCCQAPRTSSSTRSNYLMDIVGSGCAAPSTLKKMIEDMFKMLKQEKDNLNNPENPYNFTFVLRDAYSLLPLEQVLKVNYSR